jgi:hypothetical protein
MFGLSAIIGYANDEVMENIRESVLEGVDECALQARESIKEFMLASIDIKRGGEQTMKDVGRLYSMCEDSLIATDIANEVAQHVIASMQA